jgi:hypothetical protein
MISKHIKVVLTQCRRRRLCVETKWLLRIGGSILLLAGSALSAAASVLWGS